MIAMDWMVDAVATKKVNSQKTPENTRYPFCFSRASVCADHRAEGARAVGEVFTGWCSWTDGEDDVLALQEFSELAFWNQTPWNGLEHDPRTWMQLLCKDLAPNMGRLTRCYCKMMRI